MTSTIDDAAVEAFNRLAGRHMLASPFTTGPVVTRIITEAYAEQKERDFNTDAKVMGLLCEKHHARLTAECEVREELVKALGGSTCQCHLDKYLVPGGMCPRCIAINSAKKLEDADGCGKMISVAQRGRQKHKSRT